MLNRISRKDVVTWLFFLSLFVTIHILLTHYNNRAAPIKIIRLAKPMFSLHEPRDVTRYVTKDVYGRLFDIDFKFTINPSPCNSEGLLLLILVSSKPSSHAERNAIRNTYGKPKDSIKVLFLFGQSSDRNLTRQMETESSTYNDIIQGNFIDSYRNMTYKHVMALKWAAHHCPMAKYVLKADDDVIVNTDELPRFLSREMSPFGASKLMLCHPHKHSPVVREKASKWYVPEQEYPGPYYPPYCFGPFILYSEDVVISLLEQSQKMPYFFIDDAFVTGIVAEKVQISPTDIGPLFLNKDLVEVKKSTGTLPSFIMGPWELSAENMLRMWKAME